MRRTTSTLVVLLAFAVRAAAIDRPLAGDRLELRDGASATQRSVRVGALRGRTPIVDPRPIGATLEIVGGDAGDGSTGALPLDAGHWRGLGTPTGTDGYAWRDPGRTHGVRRVVLRRRAAGVRLLVHGGGSGWPYAVTQAQGPIDVRLRVGGDIYCAHFDAFRQNAPGRVAARPAPPPVRCTPCGDGVLDAGEECDDGNTTSGDGCSSTCTVEPCFGITAVPGTALATELVAEGLEAPLHATAPRLDFRRLFVVEQAGRIRVVRDGVLLPDAFLGIEGKVSCCGERGLLSVAFHPDYARTGRFFVNYTDVAGDTVVAAYQVSDDPDRADAGSEEILFTVRQPQPNHNGGQLAFGPDGRLYIGMGDGGGGGDPLEVAQNDASLLGKLLRLDVDTAGAQPEIWARGLRNPWRFSFDRATGELYLADVGQGSYEEVNVLPSPLPPGLNLGWDVFEGRHCFEPDPPATTCPDPPTGFTMPVLEYTHDEGCSVTGGFVYRGCRLPALAGTYFYGDYCAAFVRTFRGVSEGDAQNLGDRTLELAPGNGRTLDHITSFGEDARGELYVVDYGDGAPTTGEVYRIIPGS